jgi:hypothetical protein
MNLGDSFKLAKETGTPRCDDCVFFHLLSNQPTGYPGTCNLNPPQVVSHDGKLHYVFPGVAADWYCGHFERK